LNPNPVPPAAQAAAEPERGASASQPAKGGKTAKAAKLVDEDSRAGKAAKALERQGGDKNEK